MAISINNKNVGGRPSKQPSRQRVEYAIKSTQSMRMAAEYINLSYQTFRKYAKQYELWTPLPSSKGVRKRNSTKVSPYDLKKILTGENPSPFRETVLLKKALNEAYLEQKCSECGYDCTQKGWYRHRDVPLVIAIDELLQKDITIQTNIDEFEAIPTTSTSELPIASSDTLIESPELEYIPFEEFQKTLDN